MTIRSLILAFFCLSLTTAWAESPKAPPPKTPAPNRFMTFFAEMDKQAATFMTTRLQNMEELQKLITIYRRVESEHGPRVLALSEMIDARYQELIDHPEINALEDVDLNKWKAEMSLRADEIKKAKVAIWDAFAEGNPIFVQGFMKTYENARGHYTMDVAVCNMLSTLRRENNGKDKEPLELLMRIHAVPGGFVKKSTIDEEKFAKRDRLNLKFLTLIVDCGSAADVWEARD